MNWPFPVYQRPLHPELFNIHSARHLKTEHYEFIVWATGCSHVVSVCAGDLCLTELIISNNQLAASRLIERSPVPRTAHPQVHPQSRLELYDRFSDRENEPHSHRQSHPDLERFARNRGMFVAFPDYSAAVLNLSAILILRPGAMNCIFMRSMRIRTRSRSSKHNRCLICTSKHRFSICHHDSTSIHAALSAIIVVDMPPQRNPPKRLSNWYLLRMRVRVIPAKAGIQFLGLYACFS